MAWGLWKPKMLADTIFPFMTMNALMGFGVFQWPIGRPRMLISVAYAIVVSLASWSIFLNVLLTSNRSGSSKANNYFNRCVSFGNQMSAACAQILTFWHIKKQLGIIDRLEKVDKTLYRLGASFDYRQCLVAGMTTFCLGFILSVAQVIARVLWLVDPMPLKKALLLTMLTKYPVIINLVIGINFWFSAWYLGHRFYAINKLLEEPYKHIYRTFENEDFANIMQQIFHATSFNMSLCRHLWNDNYRKSFIQIIKHVHLEITLITKDLNDTHGVLMLLELSTDFVLFTTRSYLLFGAAVRTYDKKFVLIMAILSWMLPCFLKLYLINDISESVTNEAKQTGNRIYHFTHSEDDSEFSDEIKQFGLQLYNVPVRFSPVGFFMLGFQFLRGFFGTVLTYLIIVIQMDNGKSL